MYLCVQMPHCTYLTFMLISFTDYVNLPKLMMASNAKSVSIDSKRELYEDSNLCWDLG